MITHNKLSSISLTGLGFIDVGQGGKSGLLSSLFNWLV